jgi:uncharacterized tellurite resistance protein B-like protein
MTTDPSDEWTIHHDLALIFWYLLYAQNRTSSDREQMILIETLQGWKDAPQDDHALREIVLEALAVYSDESERGDAVTNALRRLYEELTLDERHRAIESAIRIAEADGLLVLTERRTLLRIADAWEVDRYAQALIDITRPQEEEWTLLHDIGALSIILAHSTDNEIGAEEVQVMVDRLMAWAPKLEEQEVRAVFKAILKWYATSPDQEALGKVVRSVRENLSAMQRLMVLSDLYEIAQADGTMLDAERDMLESLMRALDVSAPQASAESA